MSLDDIVLSMFVYGYSLPFDYTIIYGFDSSLKVLIELIVTISLFCRMCFCRDFMCVCQDALELNGRLISTDQLLYQEELRSKFSQMEQSLSYFLATPSVGLIYIPNTFYVYIHTHTHSLTHTRA